MKKKGLLLVAMVACLSLASMFTSLAGEWKQLEGGEYWQRQYINDDGTFKTNDWQQIEGKWYHFDKDGYLDVSQWIDTTTTKTQHIEGVGNYDYEETNTYWVDNEGVMATSGEWEGGVILSDGSLYIDEVGINNGRLCYWRNVGFAPKATIGEATSDTDVTLGVSDWKYNLLNTWSNTIKENYGTYTLDYQLPANWKEVCPQPIMTSNIDYICFSLWGGWGYVNWSDSWNVDENNVIHITATYYPID